MDVFSMLKFWRYAGGGDQSVIGDLDSCFDDEESFFDLVLTNSENDSVYDASGDSKSTFRSSYPDEVYSKNKRRILPLDSPNTNTKTKTPQSPLRSLLPSFQSNKSRLEKKEESVIEIEEVKIGSLLKRDNSLRCKLITEKLLDNDQMPSKRFSKEVVNKYLNLIKPSIKVSKRNNEKSRLQEKSVTPSSSPASSVFSPRKEEKRGGGRGAVFREVRKHLGKSRSASAILQTPVTKSDDTELEQQDSIKGAILHCKRSYNSPSEAEIASDCCVLSRSGSAPSNNEPWIYIEEENRSSI